MSKRRRTLTIGNEASSAEPQEAPDDSPAPVDSAAPSEEPPFLLGRPWLLMLGAVAALALLTRFVGLASNDLWFDEVHTLTDSRFPHQLSAAHALFFRVSGWVLELGRPLGWDPAFSLRLFPAICGVLSILAMVRLGWLVGGRAAGIVAGAVLLLSPFHLFYSQEARFYAPLVFAAAAAWWLAAEWATARHGARWLLLLPIPLLYAVAYRMHPAIAPFGVAHLLWLGAAVAIAPFGAAPLLQRLGPLSHPWAARGVLLGAMAATSLAAWLAVGARVRAALPPLGFNEKLWSQVVAEGPLGHAAMLLTGEASPVAFPVVAAPLLLAALAGLGILVRQAPAWWALVLGSFLATAAAVLLTNIDVRFQPKYVIFLQVPLALLIASAAAGLLAVVRTRHGDARAQAAFFGVLSAMVLLFGPGLWHYVANQKMPVTPQLSRLNAEARPADTIILNGHVAIAAGFRIQTLREDLRPRVRVIRFDNDNSAVKREMVHTARALGGDVWFVHAWPWDVAPALREYLDREGTVLARWPSSKGADFDAALYRLPAMENVPAERRGGEMLDRSILLRSEGVSTAEGTELRVLSSGEFTYRIALPEGPATLEVELTPEAGGRCVISARFGGAPDSVVFGRELQAGVRTTLRARIAPSAGARLLTLNHVSDRPAEMNKQGRDQNLLLHAVRVRAGTPAADADDTLERQALPPLPVLANGITLPGWQLAPADFRALPTSAGEDFARLALPIQRNAQAIAPPFRVAPGAELNIAGEARFWRAPNTMMNYKVVWLGANGQPVGEDLFATFFIKTRVNWEPYLEAVEGLPWTRFEVTKRAPPNAAGAAVVAFVWADGDVFQGVENQLHLRPLTVGILRPRP